MNLFDIIVLGIGISSILMGLHKGLIRLTFGLLSFFCSLVGTFFLFPIVKAAAIEHISTEIAADIVSGIVAYLISMLFFAFVNGQLTKFVQDISGGIIDRMLGLVAGALRGLVICAILFGAIAIVASNAYVGVGTLKDVADKIDEAHYPKWMTSAASYDVIENSAKILAGLISPSQLEKIKLPAKSKKLDELPAEMMNKATEIGVQQIVNQATQGAAEHKQPKDKESEKEGNLEAELKEILGD
jgi:uncharacterized membrane protein required for colicin V production